jgi:putative holliday junction resolvase
MAPLLALDIGGRRTGVAYGDDETGIVFAMDTIEHRGGAELSAALKPIVTSRKIARLVVGLPRLPGGEEGSQAAKTREICTVLERELSVPVHFVDERFTSVQRGLKTDPDARSAIAILEIVLEKGKKGVDKI